MVDMKRITVDQIHELAFTEAELMELDRARNMPISFDDDCPATTPEKAIKFRRANPVKRQTRI